MKDIFQEANEEMKAKLRNAYDQVMKQVEDEGLKKMVEFHFQKIVGLCESQFPREAEEKSKPENIDDDGNLKYEFTPYDYDVLAEIWVKQVMKSFQSNTLLNQIFAQDDVAYYQRPTADEAMTDYLDRDPISLPSGGLLEKVRSKGGAKVAKRQQQTGG